MIGWAAAKLFFGGALNRLLGALAGLWGWATKNPAAALCGLFLATTVWFWHGKGKALDQRDKARADLILLRDDIAQAQTDAHNWKLAHDGHASTISKLKGELYEQELRRNAAVATDLRLRGPGKAATCPGREFNPGMAITPDRQGGTPAQPDAPGNQVPARDGFAVVPWGWLVNRAEDHDRLLSEVKIWRSWHGDQGALHNEALQNLRTMPDPAFGN